MRQQVEKHATVASCAVCHVRIDPFGFALEKYDAIGRLRAEGNRRPAGGCEGQAQGRHRIRRHRRTADLPADEEERRDRAAVLPDGCWGMLWGGPTTLSDTSLIDEMVAEMNRNEGRRVGGGVDDRSQPAVSDDSRPGHGGVSLPPAGFAVRLELAWTLWSRFQRPSMKPA